MTHHFKLQIILVNWARVAMSMSRLSSTGVNNLVFDLSVFHRALQHVAGAAIQF